MKLVFDELEVERDDEGITFAYPQYSELIGEWYTDRVYLTDDNVAELISYLEAQLVVGKKR